MGDVFLCPRIFKDTANVTASLLQLTQIGASENHGLFKRTATHQNQRISYVGRGFKELYFIAKGNRCTYLGDTSWRAEELPTFQLGAACPQFNHQLQEFDTFAEEKKHVPATDSPADKRAKRGQGEKLGKERRKGQRGGGAAAEDCEETPLTLPTVTRAGRAVRPPKRFQV